jgi:ribulose-bisphosphate carboxylase large chain
MDWMRVHYRVDCTEAEAPARADALALEQTVEVPRRALRDAFIEKEILGQVAGVAADRAGGWRISIDIPTRATALDPAQILNLMFGNSSLHPDVECVDVEFPPSILAALGGPCFGIAGLRKLVDVEHRSLTCTALKPMGQSPAALAELLGVFARSGIDFIKDDHGLAEHDFCGFEARVRACRDAERAVADEMGRRSVYVPNLIGTPSRVARQLDFAHEVGVGAVMASPMLIGLPAFHDVVQRAEVPVFAHPSFGGAQRIRADLLFGKLYRYYGADAVIFVNFGTRFSTPEDECRRLIDHLRAPIDGLKPAMPVPGGGIGVDTAAGVAKFYGRDSILLVGGDLQVEAGRVADRSRAFVAAVAASEPPS